MLHVPLLTSKNNALFQKHFICCNLKWAHFHNRKWIFWFREISTENKLFNFIFLFPIIKPHKKKKKPISCCSFNTLTRFLAERQDSPQKGCPEYDTKLHLMVKLYFWSSEERVVALHCHYSQFHSDPEWLHLLESHQWFKYIYLNDYSY